MKLGIKCSLYGASNATPPNGPFAVRTADDNAVTKKKRAPAKKSVAPKPAPSKKARATTWNSDNKNKNKKPAPQPVLKRNKKYLNAGEDRFTIWRGLASFINPNSPIADDIKAPIERDVVVLSKLSIEASYIVHHYYTNILRKARQNRHNLIMDVNPTKQIRQFSPVSNQMEKER